MTSDESPHFTPLVGFNASCSVVFNRQESLTKRPVLTSRSAARATPARRARMERAHPGSVGASVQDAARARHGGAAGRAEPRTRDHPSVRRPAPALRPEAQKELQRLLRMDAATLSARLPELSSQLDGYRVMRELLSVAMSGEAESARARHLVRAHAGSPAWQACPPDTDRDADRATDSWRLEWHALAGRPFS